MQMKKFMQSFFDAYPYRKKLTKCLNYFVVTITMNVQFLYTRPFLILDVSQNQPTGWSLHFKTVSQPQTAFYWSWVPLFRWTSIWTRKDRATQPWTFFHRYDYDVLVLRITPQYIYVYQFKDSYTHSLSVLCHNLRLPIWTMIKGTNLIGMILPVVHKSWQLHFQKACWYPARVTFDKTKWNIVRHDLLS